MFNLWQETLDNLKLQMTNATFDTWLRNTTATIKDDSIVVAVSTRRAREVLDVRLRPLIEQSIAQVSQQTPPPLIFIVDRDAVSETQIHQTKQHAPAEYEERPLKLFSAQQILATRWPEPNWIVPGCMPEGLVIFAGKPKVGKSWLGMQLAQAVATGQPLLGQELNQGRVLYLALEDPPRRLKDRMIRQGWPENAQADFLVLGDFHTEIGPLDHGGSEILAQEIIQKQYKLVIIDTFSRSISSDQLKSNEMTTALEPIQEVAHDQHCAILIIDHHTKVRRDLSMTNVVLDIFGSVAKGALIDTAWGIYRSPGTSQAVLSITGRDVADKQFRLVMDWDQGSWESTGEVGTPKMTERRQEIVCVLQELGPSRLLDISRALDKNKGNTYKRLQDLISLGQVQQEEKNGHTFFYVEQ